MNSKWSRIGWLLTLSLAVINCVIAVAFATEHDKELEVTISVDYNPPSTFHRKSTDDYRAASAVTLTCLTNVGANEGLLYEWSSTCNGDCFVKGGTTRSISTHYLQSYDSGVHTCLVYDGVGCSGNASITMNVVGAGIYVHDGHQVLPNNSIIVAGGDNQIGEFQCISGSKRASVGHLINTAGVDTTYSTDDPFNVTRGSSYSPGMLHVQSLSTLQPDDEGVYTCETHDEREKVVSVHVALYRHNSSLLVPPIIERVKSDFGPRVRKITCVSSGSPPTNIIWTFNGQIIDARASDDYLSLQKLINRKSSAYFNTLHVLRPYDETIGDYSCTVANRIGNHTAKTSVKAMEITGHEKPFIVRLGGVIACKTALNVSKMEWILVGVSDFVEEQNAGNDTLYLPLNPTSTGLNGAMFTCRVTTMSGFKYNETITIHIKELDHTVSIEGQDNPLLAGEAYTFTCVVVTDLTPTVKWMGPDRNPVLEGEGITLGETIVEGNTTRLTMSFSPLRTSQGGSYSCLSVVAIVSSTEEEPRGIIVKIPPPLMSVIRTPNDTQLFTTSQLQLTCLIEIDPAVDTEVTVNSTWSGPSGGITSNSRITVANETMMSSEDLTFNSSVYFSYLKSSDSGTYTCSSIVEPSDGSSYIESSNSTSNDTVVDAALKVTIEISYTPPDQYPDYEPPNYRAASSVTLRCVAEEASGSVSYRWTSTCSGCFASSSTSSSISETILRSRDIGVHTCTATDSSGNTGSASTEMNIVGAGIYVTRSYDHGGSQTAQPNNTFFTSYIYYYSYTRFSIYCCSNSTSYRTGYIKSYQGTYSSNYWNYYVSQYSSGSYIGCVHFQLYSSSSYFYLSSYSSYYGLFTCTIQDNNGVNQHVNFGLYHQGFGNRPDTYSFSHVSSRDSSLTLLCKSRYAPPTSITWEKDGEPLDIDWDTIRMKQGITSYYYSYSYYDNVLLIDKQPDDVTGQYTCTVGNKFGSDTSSTVTIQGLQLVYEKNLIVSNSTTFECSSDLDVLKIQWFRDGSLIESTTDDDIEITLDTISTDDNDANYTCRVTSPYGIQERSIILEVKVPDEWGTVDISNSTNEDAVHQTDYALICTVNVIDGMALTPDFEWFNPNGSMITSDGNIDVGGPQKDGNIITSTLTFNPVLSEHGGIYTCRVSVNVPWMREQPQSHSASVDMVVTTQAMFQLRMQPVKYCAEWNFDEAYVLEESVKWNIEKAIRQRCDCDFKSSAIYSGEFSCRKSRTSVIYRAIINGTSDLHTADELMDFIEDWRTNEGTLLYNKLRLDITNKEDCPLSIQSFNDKDCHGGATTPEPLSSNTNNPRLSPDSCYTFHECD